jgi:NAD-dependent DNA ligase
LVEKGGDVVPKVVGDPAGRRSARRAVADAHRLSECASVLRRDEEAVVWRCENPSCPARSPQLSTSRRAPR